MNSDQLEKWFFAALLGVAIYLSYLVLGPYLGVLILAATLAIIFRPVYRGLVRAVRHGPTAAALCILLATVIIFIPLGFFGIRIITEATTLYGTFSAHGGFDMSPGIHQFLEAYLPNANIQDISLNFNDAVRTGLTWFIQNIGSLFSSVASAFFVIFLSLFALYYLLKDGTRLKQWMLDHVPLKSEYTEQIIGETETVLGSVIKGTLIISLIQGVVVGLGLLIFGIPNPAFWGALTVIASIIPLVGTWLVVVPAIGYLFLTGQGAAAIGFAVWSLVFVNVIYNIVSPQLIHRGAHIHPFIILLSIIGGIGAFGPVGLLVGPFVIALLFALLRVYPNLVGGKK
jgi:predicted PurR-regulated permease PerM